MVSVQELLPVQAGEGDGRLQSVGARTERCRQPQRGVGSLRRHEGEDPEDCERLQWVSGRSSQTGRRVSDQ